MASKTFKASAVSTGIAVAMGSAPPAAVAQEGDEPIEEIMVTGSHIRRTEYDGRAPIQIVDAEAIELIGAAQPVDVIKELTVNSGSQFYNETNARAGSSQFNIRNLGLGSTLTLINGKRGGIAPVADDSGTDFVDINQFPLAMIERIEVLTNGASATYGSQAVAGVANIITRKGFEGLEISGGYADSAQGLDRWHLNLAAGAGFDKGHFNVYGTYYEQGNLERSEFDWMVDRLIGQGDITRSRFLSSTGSPGSYEAADIDPLTGEAAGRGLGFEPDPNCTAAGGVITDPADTGAGADRCRYHFVDQVSVISAEKRAQVFAEFDWDISDKTRFYSEASFSNNLILRDSGGSTLNTGRANGGGFTIPANHPFNFYVYDAAQPTGIRYVDPSVWNEATDGPNAATLRAVARPLGAEVNNNELTQRIRRERNYSRILVGTDVDLTDNWYMDVSYMWAKSLSTATFPHNYRSSIFQDQVRDGRWNPFGTRLSDPTLVSPRDGVSIAGTDPLALAEWDQEAVNQASVSQQVIDLVVSGSVGEIAGNPLSMAFGGQFRDVAYRSTPDSLEAAGEANEQGISSFIDGGQNVLAFFAEAVMPIGDIGEIQVAVRNEDYGDGVSTTDPKLSFEFGLTDWLGVRGSWGTSFQAPTVRQTASASSSAFIDDPASPSGPGGTLVCVSTGLNNNIAVTVEGAPDLQPQEAENINLGLIFQTDNFRAAIDYFIFDYTDLIAPDASPQAIVNNDCLDDGIPNDPRVIRDAGGQLREVKSQFVNIGAVETSGIDVTADYNMELGSGQLSLRAGATYVTNFDVDANGDGSKDFDGAGSRNFNNSFATMPQLRGHIGGTFFVGDHAANLTMRYIDSYANDQTGNAPVDEWITFDAMYSYTFVGLLGDGDTALTIGVNNLTDEDPPALNRGLPRIDPVTGIYNRGWIDRPGYDDRAGHSLVGREIYFRFKHTF